MDFFRREAPREYFSPGSIFGGAVGAMFALRLRRHGGQSFVVSATAAAGNIAA